VALPISLHRPLFGDLVQEVAGVSSLDVQTALAEQNRAGGRLGWLLCRRGLLTRDQLREVLRRQAQRHIACILSNGAPCDFPQPVSLSVCMPAYNEALNIADTLDGACAVLPELVRNFEVVIVDDGSRDATASEVERYMELQPSVRLVRHPTNRGYGAAVTTGLRAARGDLIFFTDSDGQFSLLDLSQFLLESRCNDVVIGYRYARAENGLRRVNALAWNMLIRLLLGVRVRDLDCAFKLFRREVIDRLRLDATGAAISAEILVQTTRGQWKVRELPVTHFPRYHGAPTGAALKVIARAFGELPQLWRYRKKAALPPDPAKREAGPSAGSNGRHAAQRNGDERPAPRSSVASFPPNDAPLKICMLAACPFPANHGTPGSIREMAEAISERGHDVHLVTYHMGEEISVDGPRIHRIAPLTDERGVVVGPTVRRPLYDLQMVFKSIEVIRQYDIDLIHAHGYEAALVAWLARMATGVPVVCSAHNTMSDELPSYKFIRPRWVASALGAALDAFVPRIGDRTIPHSANIERFYVAKGLRSRTESVIYKGIKLDHLSVADGTRVRQEYRLGNGPTMLYAGVMNEFQRLDMLLEAMARVIWIEPTARLLLVVTIPSERHLAVVREYAAKLGIADKVILTDPQSLARMPEFLAASDVTVVPRPQSPGFPIKILNYMAARKPCVLFASSAGGLTHGENAYLVESDTVAALAEAILELIRDVELRERLAQSGLEFVRRHRDRRLTARQVCAAYRRTLKLADSPVPLTKPEVDPGPRLVPTHKQSSWWQGEQDLAISDQPAEILCEAGSE
jgi:glycosyltransferase involved in cell wall biosynthesis